MRFQITRTRFSDGDEKFQWLAVSDDDEQIASSPSYDNADEAEAKFNAFILAAVTYYENLHSETIEDLDPDRPAD